MYKQAILNFTCLWTGSQCC